MTDFDAAGAATCVVPSSANVSTIGASTCVAAALTGVGITGAATGLVTASTSVGTVGFTTGDGGTGALTFSAAMIRKSSASAVAVRAPG